MALTFINKEMVNNLSTLVRVTKLESGPRFDFMFHLFFETGSRGVAMVCLALTM